MSAVLKALLWIIMLPIKLIMLPFTIVGIMQKVMVTFLIIAVVAVAVIVIIYLPS